jgi:hypothetical protein
MNGNKLWPFKPRTSLLAAVLTFFILLITVITLRALNLLTQVSDTSLLTGILVLSLLPIVLSLLDNFMDRGGTLEYKGVKINFAQVPQLSSIGFRVPINIGVPGQPVSDSGTTEIIDALRKATSCNVVIIDLEDGKAWWETRLLVLLAGATRRGRPAKIVFVATDYNTENSFQGWAHANDLLNNLLSAHPQYLRSYHASMAAARQWQLVEPIDPLNLNDLEGPNPPIAPMIQRQKHLWMPFVNGLPNEFLAEQLLASDLGDKIERRPGGSRSITLVRLEELFRSILHRQHIDLAWSTDDQFNKYFESDDDFLAVTENKTYKTIISKLAILNTIVKEIAKKGNNNS